MPFFVSLEWNSIFEPSDDVHASDESIHVCKHESKAYKHTQIICICTPNIHFQLERLISLP